MTTVLNKTSCNPFSVEAKKIAFFFLFLFTVLTFPTSSSLLAQLQPTLPNEISFEHLSAQNGLATDKVISVTQDQQGFIWIGTQEGLHRYDGYELLTFTHDPDDETSLSNNTAEVIFVDQSGTIWVGTWYGLNRFDPLEKKFKRYYNDVEDPKRLSHYQIQDIKQDKDGHLWIGTGFGGVNRYDPNTDSFIRYEHDPGEQGKVSPTLLFNHFYCTCGRALILFSTQLLHRIPHLFKLRIPTRNRKQLLPLPEDHRWVAGNAPTTVELEVFKRGRLHFFAGEQFREPVEVKDQFLTNRGVEACFCGIVVLYVKVVLGQLEEAAFHSGIHGAGGNNAPTTRLGIVLEMFPLKKRATKGLATTFGYFFPVVTEEVFELIRPLLRIIRPQAAQYNAVRNTVSFCRLLQVVQCRRNAPTPGAHGIADIDDLNVVSKWYRFNSST